MKRWIPILLMCLLLGSVTTVAVAWACSLTAETWWTTNDPPLYWSDAATTWHVRIHEAGPVHHMHFAPSSLRHADDSIPAQYLLTDDELPPYVLQKLQHHVAAVKQPEALAFWSVGWPCRSLHCMQYSWRGTKHDMRMPPPPAGEPLAEHALTIKRNGQPKFLPLRPDIAGFLINTLFYASLWCILCYTFSATRRAIRHKRGRCPHCSYDLRNQHNIGCPECGWNRPPSD